MFFFHSRFLTDSAWRKQFLRNVNLIMVLNFTKKCMEKFTLKKLVNKSLYGWQRKAESLKLDRYQCSCALPKKLKETIYYFSSSNPDELVVHGFGFHISRHYK